MDKPIEPEVLMEIINDLSLDQLKRLYEWLSIYRDAKLGRMVRKLAEMNKLVHHDGHHWQVVEIFDGILLGDGDTPEQALESAGIKDD